MRIILPDYQKPRHGVMIYGLVLFLLAMVGRPGQPDPTARLSVISSTPGRAALWLGVMLLASWLIVLPKGFFHVPRQERGYRLAFACWIAGLTSLAFLVLPLLYSPIDGKDAMILGLVAGPVALVFLLVLERLLDLLFDRMRRFAGPFDCLDCGYNLRGATGNLCPECGGTIIYTQLLAMRRALEEEADG